MTNTDMKSLSYNDKKSIKNQIKYFKDDVVSFSKLSYSEIYHMTMLSDDKVDYQLKSVDDVKSAAQSRYEGIQDIIKKNEDKSTEDEDGTKDSEDVNNDPSMDSDVGESFFSFIIGFISVIIVGVLIRVWMKSSNLIKPGSKINIFQLIGIIIIIIGVNVIFTKFMNIMKMKPNKYVESDLKDIYDKIKTISNSTELNINENIKMFLKANYNVIKKEPSYNIKLTKTIDSFLKKQEQFMMKSENIGMKNSVFKQKVNKSLNFFTGKSTMEIAKELVINNNNYSAIRTNNEIFQNKLETFRYKDDMYYKKTNENDPEKENLQGIKLDGNPEKSETYAKIFKDSGSTFENELTELSTYLNHPALPDIEKCLLSVVRINKYLAILEHMGLPEYRSLKFEFLFKNTPELLTFFDLKDRYTFKDEIDVVMRLKANFEDCGNKELSSQSEFVNEKCSTYNTNQNEKIVKTYKDIVVDFTSQNNDIVVNRVHMFIKRINDEVVSKKDMTSKAKYDDVLDNITTVVREIFKYSDITKKDLILLFKTEIRTTDDTVSKPDIFLNNIRKVLDIVFLNLEEYKKNHSILDNNKNSIKRQEYIVFDQFLHKIADYEEKDYAKLENELDTLSSFVEEIVDYRSENSIDHVNKKKLNLFKESIFFYIASSCVFLVDFIKGELMTQKPKKKDEGDNTDESNDENEDTMEGGGVMDMGKKMSTNMGKKVSTMAKTTKNKAINMGKRMSTMAETAQNNATQMGKKMSNKMSTMAETAQNKATQMGKKVTEGARNSLTEANSKIVNLFSSNDAESEDTERSKGDQTPAEQSRNTQMLEAAVENATDKFSEIEFKPPNMMKLSIYISGWLFSVIILYTYWLKMDTQLTYNISVKLANSSDINNALMNIKIPVKNLLKSKENEYNNKKEMYDAIIELIELQSKCNLLRFNEESIPFPTTEIILALFLIFLCCSVIISQNLLNNPFDAMRKIKMIQLSQKNKNYITSRTEVYDLVKSLMKDALDAKSDRINVLINLFSKNDYERVESLKSERKTIASRLNELTIEKYNATALETLSTSFKNAHSMIKPIHDKYEKYTKETTDSKESEAEALYNGLENIDSIYNEYNSSLEQFKQKEFLDKKGGKYHVGGNGDAPHRGRGGNFNPMMVDPYGIQTNQLLLNSMEEDSKLETMKEMIKYTEEEENMLNELKQLDNSVVDLDSTLTNITLAFTVIAFTVFVSYKLVNNSLNFKSELLNGKLFGEGICYK